MSAPIPLEDAWDRLFALAAPLGIETIPVNQSAGRWLAQDIEARRTQPETDLSAMDGFAVAGPGPWAIVGEARAGHAFDGAVSSGQAVRISTGAACPAGTDQILLVEDAEVTEEQVAASSPAEARHIRRRGFDFAVGDALLPNGTRIGAAQIALARAGGVGEVSVRRHPRVTLIECGDELVADPVDCPSGRLPASNGAMLASMAEGVGAIPRIVGPVADDRALLARAFAEADDADVIVTSGGASVGAHDHIRGALEDCGADLAFWRVAIRPGKPLLVARLGKKVVIGLPGNPASAYVTAFLFVLPFLRAIQGATQPRPRAIPLPVTGTLPAGGARREFLRARMVDGEAQPMMERDSSALRTLAAADLLIDRLPQAEAASTGDVVNCYWLPNGGLT